jgi:ribose transport system permease protein
VALAGTAGGLFARDVSESGALTVLVMVAAGALVGVVNGVLLVKGKAPHAFVVTLATLGIARGVALLIAGGTAVVGMPSLVLTLGGGDLGPVPWPIVIVAVVTLLCWVLTRWTVWGRWIYAVGGNPEAARRAGIPVDRVLMSVYIICGALAGLAGMVAAGQTNTGAPTGGQLLELDAITAVFIGGASFLGGRGTVMNAIVGALVLGVIRNGLNLLDVSPFYQTVAVGVAIAVAIQLDVVRAHLEERFRVAQARRAL